MAASVAGSSLGPAARAAKLANAIAKPSRHALLQMYREQLRGAQKYPSKARDTMVNEVRTAWRENKNLTDPKKLQQCYAECQQASQVLAQFAGFSKDSKQWTYDLYVLSCAGPSY